MRSNAVWWFFSVNTFPMKNVKNQEMNQGHPEYKSVLGRSPGLLAGDAGKGVLCTAMVTVPHSIPGPAPTTFSRPHEWSLFIIVRRLKKILAPGLTVLLLWLLQDIETWPLIY